MCFQALERKRVTHHPGLVSRACFEAAKEAAAKRFRSVAAQIECWTHLADGSRPSFVWADLHGYLVERDDDGEVVPT
jgi:hypothetical protein